MHPQVLLLFIYERRKSMKTKKTLAMAFMLLFAISCGGGNTSGGNNSGNNQNFNNGGVITGSNATAEYNSIVSSFNAKAYSAGMPANVGIIHGGSYFTGASTGSSSFNFNFSFDFSGCLFGIGNCDSPQNQYTQYADDYRILVSKQASQNDALFGQLGTDGSLTDVTLSRADQAYRDMLNLDAGTNMTVAPIVSNARISVGNNQNIRAFIVEYFNGNNITGYQVDRFIVSPDLPVAANPIAVIQDNGFQLSLTGYLMEISGQRVRVLQAPYHQIQQTQQGVQKYQIGNIYY
jgi:hypothetical protein